MHLYSREIITLGGTFDEDSSDEQVDVKTKEKIMENCCRLEPSLKACTIRVKRLCLWELWSTSTPDNGVSLLPQT